MTTAGMIMADTTKQITTYGGSLVRHALTAAGAILVAKGLASPNDVEILSGIVGPKILGAFLYLVGQGWSLLEKKEDLKKA